MEEWKDVIGYEDILKYLHTGNCSVNDLEKF